MPASWGDVDNPPSSIDSWSQHASVENAANVSCTDRSTSPEYTITEQSMLLEYVGDGVSVIVLYDVADTMPPLELEPTHELDT